jgi:hypothetical protein
MNQDKTLMENAAETLQQLILDIAASENALKEKEIIKGYSAYIYNILKDIPPVVSELKTSLEDTFPEDEVPNL